MHCPLKGRFERIRTDRYGRSEGVQIQSIEFREVLEPRQHEYGNNTALFYVGTFDSVKDERMTNREIVILYCVVGKDDKIIGVERKYD